jgi:hypothetical protein
LGMKWGGMGWDYEAITFLFFGALQLLYSPLL